ncbi:alpha-amylase family protein [Kocuria rhizophila]|uniref:alpha-amylase family protein n=1 Tax=Kocuria TaxID=57493 RepID=UPI0005808EAE|nr:MULTISPECIES: alpha-amylase family protein [Kocuria]MXN61225.1 amylosucrase [Bacillus sp. BGMRC0062]KIC68475.1 amylosucrase [Kocuria rhizophila]MCR4525542.1 alpha-amylase family protein [Kocuria rhizophila]MCT1546300.1 alpha-amylase family protein [Kocuria rhizophila]MCT2171988.1 alpha-amylase family protein [Kocuria rhizophila]
MLTDNIPHRITGRENLLAVLQEHLVRDTRVAAADRHVFLHRLPQQLPRIVTSLSAVYGSGPEIWDVVARAVLTAWDAYAERPADLRDLDRQREGAAPWFTSREAVGGVCYVDRYAGTIAGLREQIPYFRELGLSYLHLMPLYESPAGNSDGGYAVSSYRRVDPALGTMDELAELAAELRSQGIALVLDFVFNHTSNEHEWARAAAAGDPHFERFYWIHRDRTLPDAFERTAREIFPDDHPGVFTRVDSTPAGRAASPFDPDPRWVWTTFHRFQWDLNYANPEVFHAMAGEMLFLANQGAQVLRLDAVAFIWKQLGSTCESQPQVHDLLRAFRAVAALAAPAVEFKSEAIVHPDEVIRYVHPEQCALSYNPLQMALTWEALATRDVTLLSAALAERHETPEGTAWVNYVRGHDDIGWTFSDDDAARLGVDPAGHRRFLNAFYTGRHPGSFADGVAFQDNPRTGDCRICGTTASLLGLEAEPGAAVDRILLAHSLAMSTGGVPLVYLGDEVGQLNDPHWSQEPGHGDDARWVHRPRRREADHERRHDLFSVQGRIFGGIRGMIAVRRSTPEFEGTTLIPFDTHNSHVLGYQRPGEHSLVLCLANVSDWSQFVTGETLSGFLPTATLLHAQSEVDLRGGILLEAHGFRWLRVIPVR